jgi:Spy/CpxP family protein refolding chaperone
MSEPAEAGGAAKSWRPGPRATAAIVIAVVFVVGGLAGASLFREFGHREREGGPRIVPGMKLSPAPVEEAEEGREPGQVSARTLARFAKALDLTAAQAASVDSISRHEFETVSAIREETWPRMQAVIDDTRRQIDGILTPEQRTRYHDMLARLEERWRREQAEHDSGARGANPAKRP